MMVYLLVGLSIVAVVCSAATLIMVFGIRQSIDGLVAFCEGVSHWLPDDYEGKPHGRRVTIARDHEMPDELEAAMERRASKPPMA